MGCKSVRWGFINPWVIDHNRYITEIIYIRGLLLIFFLIFYIRVCAQLLRMIRTFTELCTTSNRKLEKLLRKNKFISPFLLSTLYITTV